MTEQWKWASVKRIKEAAEELKAMIRVQYPDARFRLSRASDDRDAWDLWTLADLEDPDRVNDLVREREREMLIEERIPLYAVPTLASDVFADERSKSTKRAG